MQQGDQPGTAVALPEGPFQKGPNLSDAAGTMGVDPIAQRAFLLVAEAAAAAFVAEALQFGNAASLKGAMPVADRVVVQQQSRRDTLAAPALVEKDDGVRPAGDAMLRKSIPRKPGQGSSVLSRQKTATNHTPSRILFPRNVNKFLGSSMSRSISRIKRKGAKHQAGKDTVALDRLARISQTAG